MAGSIAIKREIMLMIIIARSLENMLKIDLYNIVGCCCDWRFD